MTDLSPRLMSWLRSRATPIMDKHFEYRISIYDPIEMCEEFFEDLQPGIDYYASARAPHMVSFADSLHAVLFKLQFPDNIRGLP